VRSVLAGLRTLVLPWGAAPGTSRIVLGPDVPAILSAYYLAQYGATIQAVILFYYGGTPDDYLYEAHYTNDGNSEHARGWVIAGTVYELDFYANDGVVTRSLIVGEHGSAPSPLPMTVSYERGAYTRTGPMQSIFNLSDDFDVFIDGRSQGRGLMARISSTAASAAIGAEAIVLTLPSITFHDGRAYEVYWSGQTQTSLANTTTYRVRKTNLAGAIQNTHTWITNAAGNDLRAARFECRRATGAGDLALVLVLTLQASAGTCTMAAAATQVRYLEVRDVGSEADYPNAINL
jgi:hypothetical protein